VLSLAILPRPYASGARRTAPRSSSVSHQPGKPRHRGISDGISYQPALNEQWRRRHHHVQVLPGRGRNFFRPLSIIHTIYAIRRMHRLYLMLLCSIVSRSSIWDSGVCDWGTFRPSRIESLVVSPSVGLYVCDLRIARASRKPEFVKLAPLRLLYGHIAIQQGTRTYFRKHGKHWTMIARSISRADHFPSAC
jgi:hypothetical protein